MMVSLLEEGKLNRPAPVESGRQNSFRLSASFIRTGTGAVFFCLFSAIYLYGAEQGPDPIENPHFNPSKCYVCHDSFSEEIQKPQVVETVTHLCQRCHDGTKAKRELHPVGMKPSPPIAEQIPQQFPLHGGKLSCLSCHDISIQCEAEPQSVRTDRNFLRGDTRMAELCPRCHKKKDDIPFNPHDQLDETGKPKLEVCLWCHLEVPELSSDMKASKDFGLRSESHIICRNCHPVHLDHPVGGKHILVEPSKKTVQRMAQYVGISPEQYSETQVFPMDEKGCVTCFSCHNPHERGLFTGSNPRSLGAESTPAQ